MKFSLLNMEINDRHDADVGKTGRTILLTGSCIFCIIIGVIISYFFILPHWSTILHNSIFINSENLNNNESEILSSLIAQNKVHTINFVIERLVGFYETQIQYLIGIFAIFGMIGFFYIKCSHRRDITEELQDYMNSKTGILILQNIVQEYIKDEKIKPIVDNAFNKERNEGIISEIYDDISNLKSRIEELSREQINLSSRLDTISLESESGEIDFPNEDNIGGDNINGSN